MKKVSIFCLSLLLLTTITSLKAQTADEILKNYYSTIDPDGKLKDVETIIMKGTANFGIDIPFETAQQKGGMMYVKLNIRGQEVKQQIYDGNELWELDFSIMQTQKADAESTANKKLSNNDFPDELYNYKANGYTVEYLGKDTKEGTECYKIKLTKTPLTVDGEKVENIVYYYFDTESNLILFSESMMQEGEAKGQLSLNSYSDYQEVDGIYFPFAMNMDGAALQAKEIILNSKIDPKEFRFQK